MKSLKLFCILSLIFAFYLIQIHAADTGGDDDWEKWEEKDESDEDNKEWSDEQSDSAEDYERVIEVCGKNGPCTCIKGKQSVLNCSSARISAGKEPLDTALLKISATKYKDFKADIVRLDHNEIEALRKGEILPGQEPNVRYLDLSSSRISSIEPYIFDSFVKLAKLKLTHNRLRTDELKPDWLTESLGKSLHQLFLDHNELRNLDNGLFDNLVNLKKLVLDDNAGLNVKKELFTGKLAKLQILSLENCKISSLKADVFENLQGLTAISLAGNPLSMNSILAALSKLPNLSTIVLSEINLGELKANTFANFNFSPKLQNIYLRNLPKLKTIGSCAFCGLPELKLIDLTNSSLMTLNEDILSKEKWTSLGAIRLAQNPMKCDDCIWLQNSNALLDKAKDSKCASPSNVAGMDLKSAKNLICDGFSAGGSSSQFFLVFLILFGMCASLFVAGYVYARRRTLMPTASEPPAAFSTLDNGGTINYSNLTTNGGITLNEEEDEDVDYSFDRPEFV